MRAKFWDESARTYSEIEVPDGCSYYEHDLGAMVTCPDCGRTVSFGDCFTSRRFYAPNGILALSVCPACHKREWANE